MQKKGDKILESISRARSANISEEVILNEIKKQNPEKAKPFDEAKERGVSDKEIIDEIIRQNTEEKVETEKKESDDKKEQLLEDNKEESTPTPSVLSSSTPSPSDEVPQEVPQEEGFTFSSVDDNQPTQNVAETAPSDFLKGSGPGEMNIGSTAEEKVSFIEEKKGLLAIAGGVFLFLFVFLFIFLRAPLKEDISDEDLASFPLSEQQITLLTEPAVVKIGNFIEGAIILQDFTVNFEDLEINQLPESGEEKIIEVREYIEGTGFITTANGFILTSAHVVTKEEVKNRVMFNILSEMLEEEATSLMFRGEADKVEEYREKIENVFTNYQDEEAKEKLEEWTSAIFYNAVLDLEQKLFVFDLFSGKEDLGSLAEAGFDVEVIFVNEDYRYNQKDVALIKLNMDDLPAIPLGHSEQAQQGDLVYTFGFPSTTKLEERSESMNDMDDSNDEEIDDTRERAYVNGGLPNKPVDAGDLNLSSLPGTIASFLESSDGSFNFFRLDIQAFSGIGGGPVIDEEGMVVGLMSFVDNAGRTIPLREIKRTTDVPGEFPPGDYYRYMRRGVYFMSQNKCALALREFDLAKMVVNEKFYRGIENANLLISNCEEIIERGDSVDTRWDSIVK
jgi:hypothetical protein